MLAYKPVLQGLRPSMAQAKEISTPPTPVIDPVFAGYEGVPGIVSTAALLAIAGSAAYVGIKTGLNGDGKLMKALGWIGGVGSAALGLFYLGQKTGFSIGTNVPAVNVYPA